MRDKCPYCDDDQVDSLNQGADRIYQVWGARASGRTAERPLYCFGNRKGGRAAA